MGAYPDRQEIQRAILDKYKKIAHSAEGMFNYATGTEGARALGYDSKVITKASSRFLRSFCGVGNPFTFGEIRKGIIFVNKQVMKLFPDLSVNFFVVCFGDVGH